MTQPPVLGRAGTVADQLTSGDLIRAGRPDPAELPRQDSSDPRTRGQGGTRPRPSTAGDELPALAGQRGMSLSTRNPRPGGPSTLGRAALFCSCTKCCETCMGVSQYDFERTELHMERRQAQG